MRVSNLLAALACMTALPAYADTVSDCDDYRSALTNIAEPWEANTVNFTTPDGDVRLVVIDTYEPAAAAYHLLILSPPFEMDSRQCKVVSYEGTGGFRGLTTEGAKMEAKGSVLTFTLSAVEHDPDTDSSVDAKLTVTLDIATGQITSLLE